MLDSFNIFINGQDGLKQAISEHGKDYFKLAFRTVCDESAIERLERALVTQLVSAWHSGAKGIVWRRRPLIQIDADGYATISARLHFLPIDKTYPLDITAEGQSIPII